MGKVKGNVINETGIRLILDRGGSGIHGRFTGGGEKTKKGSL